MGEQTDLSVESRQLPSKRVFVEVGTGGYATTVSNRLELSEDEVYIGIEINPKDVKTLKNNLKIYGKSNRSFIVNADARKMPMPDKSVDEIFFRNVFGDPSVINYYSKRGDDFWSEIQIKPFLREAIRVLKSKGVLTIMEDNTPLPSDKLTEFLKRNGFRVDSAIHTTDPNWIKSTQEYVGVQIPEHAKSEYIEESGKYRRVEEPYILHASPIVKE